MSHTSSSTSAPENVERFQGRWLGLVAIMLADLLNLLQATIGVIAGPVIRADLGGSQAMLQWIIAGYTLALAVGLLIGGRLGDMFGRKRMIMVGTGGFVVSSILAAIAPTPEILLLFRVLQGVFGAILIPQGFGLLRNMFGRQIGKAFGILGPVFGLSSALGPIVAGFLINADLWGTGWRMIFLMNVPLGVIAMLIGAKIWPNPTPTAAGTRLDIGGALLAGAAMGLLIYPLVQGYEEGWPAWSFVLLAISVILFVLFAFQQMARSRTGRTTLIEISVFTKRSYLSGVVFVTVFFGILVAMQLVITFLLTLGLGYDSLDASYGLATMFAGAFIGTAISSMLYKYGRIILQIALPVMLIGLIAMSVTLNVTGETVNTLVLAAPIGIFGIGMGMIFVPVFDIIVGDLEDKEIGSASGLLEAFQQGGVSLGVAALGTVFFAIVGASTTVIAFVDALNVTTLIAAGLVIVLLALTFLLPRKAREGATH